MAQRFKILIATGIYPPDVGGPAKYAKNLFEEFSARGHQVKVVKYGLERKLPVGLRQLVFLAKLVSHLPGANFILALDNFSVGLPCAIAAKIFGAKVILRNGGDFLWESYVEQSGQSTTLAQFYEKTPVLFSKQKIILAAMKFILKNCSALVFNAVWLEKIYNKFYGLEKQKNFLVENYFGPKLVCPAPVEKTFLWAGRPIKLKNISRLRAAFKQAQQQNNQLKLVIRQDLSRVQIQEEIKNSYAVILPSLSEVGPNFILEAISFNKPFILTRETGFFEKLKNVGIFIDPQSEGDIKEKILFLADDKNYGDYKNRISDFNFTHSWNEIAKEFLEIYLKIK